MRPRSSVWLLVLAACKSQSAPAPAAAPVTASVTAPVPGAVSVPVPENFASLARAIDPSVVTIVTAAPGEDPEGLGSGLIIDRSGRILTNSHVVPSGAQIQVILSDEREAPARVVGRDPE